MGIFFSTLQKGKMPIFLKIFYGFYPIRDLIFFLLVLMPLKKSVFVQKKGDAGGMKTGGPPESVV